MICFFNSFFLHTLLRYFLIVIIFKYTFLDHSKIDVKKFYCFIIGYPGRRTKKRVWGQTAFSYLEINKITGVGVPNRIFRWAQAQLSTDDIEAANFDLIGRQLIFTLINRCLGYPFPASTYCWHMQISVWMFPIFSLTFLSNELHWLACHRS